jgi:RNA polymerase sigma factor (sigma-70 family)
MTEWQLAEPTLRRFLAKMRFHGDEADDVLQTAWLTAWTHAHQFAARGSTAGWFYRICQSVARQAIHRDRQLSPGAVASDIADEEGPSESGEYRQLRLDKARLAVLDSLSPRRRAIVRAKFLNGQSDDEIAASLGCRPSTVRTTIHFVRNWCRAHDPAANDEISVG